MKITLVRRTYFTLSTNHESHKSDQRLLLNYGILSRGRVKKMDLELEKALIHFAKSALAVKSQPALSALLYGELMRTRVWLQALIKASFSSQTFSWMLISLPHLLLLCLSSTSLHLAPPLVLSPHLSASPLPVLLPPLPLFFPSCSHLSCAQRLACALLAW